jgi:hypothetical protein
VTFSDVIVVGRSFTATEFLKRLLFVRSGARLYWELWSTLYDHTKLPPIGEVAVPTRESGVVARPQEAPSLASLEATAQVIQSPQNPYGPGNAGRTATT